MQKTRLSVIEEFLYYAAVILSLGGIWLVKIVIVKAILDAFNQQEAKRQTN